ncbi:hypothetical protein EDC04DRAFT_1055334 [Pisolithus marmoratus]|nr:hypothetical protein EDC04DRAFT_1055334 [Pisolithus marmoratus]
MYYDRTFNVPSMVQEIEALQAKLDETEGEDEQRVLEEDITGKILWLCWSGICAEADELLQKVEDYIRREDAARRDLWELRKVMNSTTYTDPGDDLAHLRRIMFDAGAGTSKHDLWLAAQAAEQAKWSGTARHTSTIDTHPGNPGGTSCQTPSTSVV